MLATKYVQVTLSKIGEPRILNRNMHATLTRLVIVRYSVTVDEPIYDEYGFTSLVVRKSDGRTFVAGEADKISAYLDGAADALGI